MSEEEKAQHRKGDEIDDIPTSELEKSSHEEEEEGQEDNPYRAQEVVNYFDENRINLARAFLGYKGGYSVRKLKKFYKQSLMGGLDEEGNSVRDEFRRVGQDSD